MRPPPLDVSSPAHARSPSSATQDHPSPSTPDSGFSSAVAPAVASPDEFALQLDVQLDPVMESPRKADPCFGDDASKVQVLLRNAGRWRAMCDRLESTPPPRPRVPPIPRDSTGDDFPWEATIDSEASRCSLLIQEVSLLVGLTADDETLPLPDVYPLSDPPDQVHDILPLNISPTKSLTSRKRWNAGPLNSTTVAVRPSEAPVTPQAGSAISRLYDQGHHPSVGSRHPAMPIPRHKAVNPSRSSLFPHRRQGQVFHFEPSFNDTSRRHAIALDEMFSDPRKPPPRPTQTPVNRSSSLDRLEYSLRKLQAHAPANHRKSQSEGPPLDHFAHRQEIPPSLPPTPCLKRLQSHHEIVHSNPSRLAYDRRASRLPPVPRPSYQYVSPRSCPAVPSDEDPFEEDHTPGSFMDMDIPLSGEAQPKEPASFRQSKSKEKVKGLAKRMSRGVIALGKTLTGSTKRGSTK